MKKLLRGWRPSFVHVDLRCLTEISFYHVRTKVGLKPNWSFLCALRSGLGSVFSASSFKQNTFERSASALLLSKCFFHLFLCLHKTFWRSVTSWRVDLCCQRAELSWRPGGVRTQYCTPLATEMKVDGIDAAQTSHRGFLMRCLPHLAVRK